MSNGGDTKQAKTRSFMASTARCNFVGLKMSSQVDRLASFISLIAASILPSSFPSSATLGLGEGGPRGGASGGGLGEDGGDGILLGGVGFRVLILSKRDRAETNQIRRLKRLMLMRKRESYLCLSIDRVCLRERLISRLLAVSFLHPTTAEQARR
jgi:hypothetical protein